jgi:CheY-like chemotaxis protein
MREKNQFPQSGNFLSYPREYPATGHLNVSASLSGSFANQSFFLMNTDLHSVISDSPCANPSSSHQGEEEGKKKYRVLHLDDDPDYLAVYKILFERFGHMEIDTVSNPGQAIDLIRTQSYDIIFTDLDMPGMSGIGFIEKIRSKYSDLPIIILSVNSEPDSISFDSSLFYLSKTLPPFQLMKRIREIMKIFFT